MISEFRISPRISTARIREIAAASNEAFTLLYTKPTDLRWVNFGLERLLQVGVDTGAAMIYADHFAEIEGEVTEAPVIDCQKGALRDDFDFGGVQVYRTSVLREAVAGMTEEYEFAGLYDLRLRASRLGPLVHVNEFL